MNDKLLILLRKLINILKYSFAGIWAFLTIIVIIFLIDRWQNPGWKSISNRDLNDYGIITLMFFTILAVLKYIDFTISKKLNK